MTSRRTRGVLASLALALVVTGASSRAVAQGPDEQQLKAARELFQEAYRDEQERRFDQALDKFQRVAKVRESTSVRYRIASVLESLGRLREARDAFRALAVRRLDSEKKDQEVADSAAERAASLDKRIPRLVLRLDGAPPDSNVTIDAAPVQLTATPRSIELDPGEHVVRATATNARPFESNVKLAEGGEVALGVVLARSDAASAPVDAPGERVATPNRTLAYIALGAGGAFFVTGIVLLVVREGEIGDLNRACPSGQCPIGQQSSLQSEHDRAQLFGPLGVGAVVVGAMGVGAGIYLLSRPAPRPTGFRLAPHLTRGGAGLGVAATF